MPRWIRIVILIVLVIVFLFTSAYVYLFPMNGLERVVSSQLNREIRERYNLSADFADMRGNPFTGIMIEDIRVIYTDSLGAYEILRVPRLTTAYQLSNLWHRDYRFELVDITSPKVTIRRDSTGAWRLPDLTSDVAETTRPPSFLVSNLIVSEADMLVIAPGRDTMQLDDMTVAASVRVEEGMVSADLKQMEFVSPSADVELTAATGKVALSDNRLVVQDLAIASRQTRARLNGAVTLDDLTGRIDFALDQVDLAEVTRWVGPNLRGVVDLTGSATLQGDSLDGSVNVAGDFMFASFENLQVDFRWHEKQLMLDTLYGVILDNCSIDGAGWIDFNQRPELYELTAELQNFNLNELIEGTFASDLNGAIQLAGESFKNETLVLRINADLYESSFDEYPLHRAFGDMVITTDSISFPDVLTVDYYENQFTATGVIDYDDDMFLEVDVDLPNLDRYRERLFISQPGGRGHAHGIISGRTGDPDLAAIFQSDSVWVYGLYADSCRIETQVDRFLNARQGWVTADFYEGELWGLVYDSTMAVLTLDSQYVVIDTADVQAEDISAWARGGFDYGIYPNTVRMDTVAVDLFGRGFANRQPLDIDIDSASFIFNEFTFEQRGGLLSMHGRVDYDESMDFTASADSILIAPWLRLFRPELPVNGYVSFDSDVAGTFVNPIFTLTGLVDSLTYRDLKLGDLTASGDYRSRILTIDSAVVLSDSGRYSATGFLNADLAFVTDSLDRLPDLPFDIRMTARDNQFDLISLLLPTIEQLFGDFTADVHLTGTPSQPQLEGSAMLRDAKLKYFDLANWIFADSVPVRMENNRIVFDRIESFVIDERKSDVVSRTVFNREIEGRPSYAYIEGDITVQSLDNFVYDVYVSIPREFPFTYELEDIRGVFEGDLHVVGETPPTVEGDITLISCRYRVPFAAAEEGSPILQSFTQENSWDLDLNIEILSNYWIENEDIDAEFAGEINLIREEGNYPIVGEMDILRGRGFLFDKTFRLEPRQEAVIFTGTEVPNPQLDIIANTRIPGVRFDQETTSDVLDLCIHVTGTLDTAEINPCQESEFSREDILPLLALNYYGADTGSYSGAVTERVAQLVSSQVSQIGGRQLNRLIGVETFEIDPTYGGEFDPAQTRVTVGAYAAPNLYVYGRSSITGNLGEEVGFEYRFSREFLLQGRRNELEEYIVNLRLHWEF